MIMKSYIRFVAILHITFSLGLLFGCGSQPEVTTEEAAAAASDTLSLSAEQWKTIGIETAGVEMREVPEIIQANGKLDVPPQNLVTVSAVLGGFVKETSLLQGMRVKKGQVLVTLQHPDYIQLQQDYLETVSLLELATQELKRQEDLAKENINAQKTLQQARAEYARMKAREDGLAGKLQMIHLTGDHVKKEGIQQTVQILSPISGFVTEVMVNAGMFVAQEKPMFRIVDTEHLHAELQVFEKDILRVKNGQNIRLRLVNESTDRHATVYLVGKEISEERTVRVHGHMTSHDPNLLPGMFFSARVEVNGEKGKALPESAFEGFEGADYIFVAAGDRVFRMVQVKKESCVAGYCRFSFVGPESEGAVAVKGTHALLGLLKNTEE